jgi:hypothetical protein
MVGKPIKVELQGGFCHSKHLKYVLVDFKWHFVRFIHQLSCKLDNKTYKSMLLQDSDKGENWYQT